MILPENFTIKQTQLLKELFNQGYKIKKYNGTNLMVVSKGITDVTIIN
jgi:hypothetical protein